jgi:transposase
MQYAASVSLSPRQRFILERLARSRTLERRLVERVQIVLRSAEGQWCVEQAAALGVDPQRVSRWRRRWAKAADKLAAAESPDVPDDKLEAIILEVLSDSYRSGTPPTFTAEQLAQLIALACEEPKCLGLPVTHWTPRELALEAQRRGIVESISPRHVARFFGGGRSSSASVALLAESQDRRPGALRKRGSSRL